MINKNPISVKGFGSAYQFHPNRHQRKPKIIGCVYKPGVIAFLTSILREQGNQIRTHICAGCRTSHIYDKNNQEYPITWATTLEEVKAIIEGIREINNQ